MKKLIITNYLYINTPKSELQLFLLLVSDSSQQIFGFDQKVQGDNYIEQETHGQKCFHNKIVSSISFQLFLNVHHGGS